MTSPSKLNEYNHAERPALNLLMQLGWTYIPRKTLALERDNERQVLLKRRLKTNHASVATVRPEAPIRRTGDDAVNRGGGEGEGKGGPNNYLCRHGTSEKGTVEQGGPHT